MDEFNLADRFAGEEEEPPRRGRGKLRRLRRGKTGVGMEKPADNEGLRSEFKDRIPEEDEDLDLPEHDDLGAMLGPEDEMEEDEAFNDLVERMEGGSASAGRRAKLKGRRPAPRHIGREDEE